MYQVSKRLLYWGGDVPNCDYSYFRSVLHLQHLAALWLHKLLFLSAVALLIGRWLYIGTVCLDREYNLGELIDVTTCMYTWAYYKKQAVHLFQYSISMFFWAKKSCCKNVMLCASAMSWWNVAIVTFCRMISVFPGSVQFLRCSWWRR
jgi:hypothetical protein